MNFVLNGRRFFRTLENLFFVPMCCACKERLLPNSFELYSGCLCKSCYDEWNRAKHEICPECKKEVCKCVCSVKGELGSSFERIPKLVFYHPDNPENKINQIIYSLKHTDDCRLARFLADELAIRLTDEFKKLGFSPDRCLYTWVPRRSKAISEYGFDQGKRICRYLAKTCGGEIKGLFVRLGGKEQKKLDARQRIENVSSHIRLKRFPKAVPEKYDCVVLIDDVVTTGATVFSAQKLLKSEYNVKVIFASIGQTAI